MNIGKTNILESMVKQKRMKITGFQHTLSTMNEEGKEKLICPDKQIRLLGINLEQNLSWNAHILTGRKAILPATRKQLGALKSISKEIPQKSRLQLANSLIMSRISYGIAL